MRIGGLGRAMLRRQGSVLVTEPFDGTTLSQDFRQVNSAGLLSIVNGQLQVNGGLLAATGGPDTWGDPGVAWARRPVPRGYCLELDLTVTTAGYLQVGWSTTPALTQASLRHNFYVHVNGQVKLHDTGAEATENYIGHHYVNTTYSLRIYALAKGGAYLEVHGGHYGTAWRALAYDAIGTDNPLYPAVWGYNAVFTVDNWRVVKLAPPVCYVIYHNGTVASGAGFDSSQYRIGRGILPVGTQAIARQVESPVLSLGAPGSYNDYLCAHPWVLWDSGTYRMWYSASDGTNYRVGYATSTDGLTWTDNGSAVLNLGAGGTWDDIGVHLPLVYKDNAAAAGKRWRMIYCGNDGSNFRIGYAFAASPEGPWTKGAANPVVDLGGAGTWDDVGVAAMGMAIQGSTFYLYYDGYSDAAFPNNNQGGLVTFTDFEGTYTKSLSNPVLAQRTGNQALTDNVAVGDTSIPVGDSSVFVVNELICLVDAAAGTSQLQQCRVATIPDGTHVTITPAAHTAFTVANSARLRSMYTTVAFRSVILSGDTWHCFGTGYHVGITASMAEATFHATSSDGITWTIDHAGSPPMWLPTLGRDFGWDARSSENPMIVLDADTFLPLKIAI